MYEVESSFGGVANQYFYELFPDLTMGAGVRKLSASHQGFNVRLGTTASTGIIGYHSGFVDTVALATLCGATEGRVSIAYDVTVNDFDGLASGTGASGAANWQLYDGSAINLDTAGNQTIDFANTDQRFTFSQTITNEFALFMWVECSSVSGVAYLFATESYGTSGKLGFTVYRSGSALQFYNYNGSTFPLILNTAAFFTVGDPFLLTVTRQSDNKIRVYKDSALIATSVGTTTLAYNPTYLTLGSLRGSAPFAGKCSEILFFNNDIISSLADIQNNILASYST
jgi:hypothetical protein